MRIVLLGLCLALSVWAQDAEVVSGTLKSGATLATSQGDVQVVCDPNSDAVLHDGRLIGMGLELRGRLMDKGHFQLGDFHLKPLRVVKDGAKKEVTYWCAVCSIRTYTPGKCLCCQEETELDLRDPEAK